MKAREIDRYIDPELVATCRRTLIALHLERESYQILFVSVLAKKFIVATCFIEINNLEGKLKFLNNFKI